MSHCTLVICDESVTILSCAYILTHSIEPPQFVFWIFNHIYACIRKRQWFWLSNLEVILKLLPDIEQPNHISPSQTHIAPRREPRS